MASHPFIHKFSFSYIPVRLLLPTDSDTGFRSCPSIRFHASPLQTPHPARHTEKHGLSVLKILCTLLHLPASRMPAVPAGYNGLSLLNNSSGAAFSYNGASTGRCTSFFQAWYIAPFSSSSRRYFFVTASRYLRTSRIGFPGMSSQNKT